MVRRPSRTRACRNSSTSSVANAADALSRESHVPAQHSTAGHVHSHESKRLIHGHQRVAIAADAGAIAQGALQGLAEHNAHVLDRVVVVNLRVAAGLDVQIEQAVHGHVGQHVVEEGHAGGDAGPALPIELQGQRDCCLSCCAFDRRGAHSRRAGLSPAASLCRKPRRVSLPWLAGQGNPPYSGLRIPGCSL